MTRNAPRAPGNSLGLASILPSRSPKQQDATRAPALLQPPSAWPASALHGWPPSQSTPHSRLHTTSAWRSRARHSWTLGPYRIIDSERRKGQGGSTKYLYTNRLPRLHCHGQYQNHQHITHAVAQHLQSTLTHHITELELVRNIAGHEVYIAHQVNVGNTRYSSNSCCLR